MHKKYTVLDICLISILTTIIFVQEQALTILPNIQLTILLLILYSKKLGFIKTTLIIIIHVILDNIFMGSFGLIMIPMFCGWMLIPIIMCTIFQKTNNVLILALGGVICSLLYSLCFTVFNVSLMHYNLKAYLIADLPFTLLLIGSSVLSILLLYLPLDKVMNYLIKKTDVKEN